MIVTVCGVLQLYMPLPRIWLDHKVRMFLISVLWDVIIDVSKDRPVK